VIAWEEGKGESWTWSERDESSLMSSGDTIQQHPDSNRIGQPRNEEKMPASGMESQKRGVVLAKRAAAIDGD
jgi:hypothetical protein